MSPAPDFRPMAALFLGLCACGSSEVEAARKPLPKGPAKRAVLITCDSLRVDRMSTYGYARPTTPEIDALAKSSVTFTNAWTTAPGTLPSIAALLTGALPGEVGVTTDSDTAMVSATTVAEVARDAGFGTAAIVSNGVLRDMRGGQGDVGIQQGFTVYDANMTPSPAGHGMQSRSGADTTAAALRWLDEERHAEDRFFLWVHYSDAHGPYLPAEAHAAAFRRDHANDVDLPLGTTDAGVGAIPRYQVLEGVTKAGDYLDRYDAEVHELDAAVGALVRGLADRGWLDDALVVFTANHGVSFGEHGWWFSHGTTLQREVVHVPLIVKPPQDLAEALTTQDGRRNGKLAMHLDVFPTILAALGIPARPAQGVSLLQERLPEGRVAPQVLGRGDPALDMLGVTDGRWRLVSTGAFFPTLYDVLSDPLETKNVGEQNAHVVARLTERWRELLRRAGTQAKSNTP
jgi:arylsulfatase A-like enzyme